MVDIDLHHPSTIWSVTFKSNFNEPETNDFPCIKLSISFSHWHEVHHHCHDPNSPLLDDDHNALFIELLDCNDFGGSLVFPLDPDTLPFYMAAAEEEAGLPEFVTPGAWSYLRDKVLSHLFQNVEFDPDQGLGFHCDAHLDVCTVDVFDDRDQLGECSDDDACGDEWGGCSFEDFKRFEVFAEQILE